MEAKFKLGQSVYMRQGLADCETRSRVGLVTLPKSFVIFAVMREECHGGVQHHYIIRLDGETTRVNESELADPSEWNIKEWISAIDKARKDFPQVKEWAGE